MDPALIVVWILRIAFLLLLYLFLAVVVRALARDLRVAAREPGLELGRLVVVATAGTDPPAGAVYPLDAVTTIGRDVNNTIALDDPFVSGDHAVLTYRGTAWFVEDRGSTNGTFVNGHPIAGIATLGFGDELAIGRVRLRLDRGRR